MDLGCFFLGGRPLAADARIGRPDAPRVRLLVTMVPGYQKGWITTLSIAVMNSRLSITVSRGTAWGVALGMLAGWLAAGSLGILAVALQATLVWLVLAVVLLCVRPQFTPAAWLVLATLLAGMAVLPLAMVPVRVGLTLTVAAALSWLATGLAGAERRLMLIGGLSVLTLVLYRLAQQSIPAVWMLSDVTGGGLGRLAATGVGRPLAVGATFAGLDILVVMFVFCVGWVTMLRGPRWSAMVFAAAAVLTVHVVYLIILALTHDIVQLAARGGAHREQSVCATSVQLAGDRAAAASLESARAGSAVPDGWLSCSCALDRTARVGTRRLGVDCW